MTCPSEPDRGPIPNPQWPANCREARRTATDFLDGRMRAAEREPVQHHLRRCESCRSFYREFVALGARSRRAARSAPVVDRGSLTERVLDEARRRRREVLRELDDGLSGSRTTPAPAPGAPRTDPRRDRTAAGLATWIAVVVATTAIAGFLLGRWTARDHPRGPRIDTGREADAPLPGDPHRLRQREDDGRSPDAILDPEAEPDNDPAPSRSEGNEPDVSHMLTGDR